MAEARKRQHAGHEKRKRSWRGHLARFIWVVVPLAVAFVAYSNRSSLAKAAGLLEHAQYWWLTPAGLLIGGVYLCRSAVYRVPLVVLGYTFTRRFLWSTALVSTSIHQLIPTAGASGYAFLTWALHQRGVATGQASLIALIDTLSYAVAVATLVIGSLAYFGVAGTLQVGHVATAFAPGIVLVALAAWVYYLQRDSRRFIPLVLRWKHRVASLFHAHWDDAPVRRFLEEYYEGKSLIRSHPGVFYRMVGFQYLSTFCDAGALYMAFLALGLTPKPWVVYMGFVVSMAGLAVLSVPGGGGSFEVIMSAYFAQRGFQAAQGIAAAILYRVVAFWLPVAVSVVLLFRLRRKHREVKRVAKGIDYPSKRAAR